MASQSLYRKWRSQAFSEVVGQEPITLTLQNALSTGRIAHAYLFCGPRGTGKTSSGRIMAKALNCRQRKEGEPCNECDNCLAVTEGRALDLIEIDAASNRGIDEIRDLREKVRFAPAQSPYKVYIIDEVHMLTTDAFNALLKTLEEPPAHVIFILCTTEAHRVPATVMSRCQRFDFRRISLSAAVGRLKYICDNEGIEVDTAGLELVAKASSGSLRDAENVLDQLIAYYGEHIDVGQVRDLLGMVGDVRMARLVGHLVRGELSDGLRVINDVVADGHDLRQFNREMVDQLRSLLLVKVGSSALVEASREELADLESLASAIALEELIGATKIFSQLDLRYDGQSSLPIELALVECLLDRQKVRAEVPRPDVAPAIGSTVRMGETESGISRLPPSMVPDAGTMSLDSGSVEAIRGPAPVIRSVKEPRAVEERLPADGRSLSPIVDAADPGDFVKANWSRVLEMLRSENRALETYIVPGNTDGPYAVDGERVILGVGYDVHKSTLDRPQHKKTVEDVLKRALGKKYVVQCVVVPKGEDDRLKRAAEDPVIQEALKHGARIAKVE
ncbi:MAG: DNA polymerase III subunit gamma/tau [Dehalococcoidia bacterium]|nr:DNA polymerase III subunit gamma/tau [Dehalococcoidia bacterium]